MKKKMLGRTDLAVTEICLGTMTWGRQNTEDEGHRQIDYALDRGVNFMDTAEMYAIPATSKTYGRTEEIIGAWFKKTGKRDKFILASKIAGGGQSWVREGRAPNRADIRAAVEGSLRRLQTDYIDLYQIHWPARGHYHFENSWTYDPTTQDREKRRAEMVEVLDALAVMVGEGKIRHLGLSNETAWGVAQWVRLSEDNGLPRMASIQNEYSLMRRLFDHDLAEACHYDGVGLLAYSALAAGALSGKYLDGAMPEGSRGAISGGLYRNNRYSEPAIRAYIDLARDNGHDPCQMALAFALGRPFMTSVIIGATTMEQLEADIGAAEVTLSQEVLDGIEAIYRRYPRPI